MGIRGLRIEATLVAGSILFLLVTMMVAFFVIVGAIQDQRAAGINGRLAIQSENKQTMAEAVKYREQQDELRDQAQQKRDAELQQRLDVIDRELKDDHHVH